MGLILDSSVVVAAERRGHSVPQILEQIRSTYGEVDVALSVVTIAELVHGAYRAKADADCLDVPVHPVTLEMARTIGRIEGEQAAKGIALAFEDLAIGVTALELGFGLATLNLGHFQMISSLKIASATGP